MIIVVAEIESWYIAGLKKEKAIEWKIEEIEKTELVTKEVFNQLYFKRFNSRLDFMQEILKEYDYELAKERNASFNYFFTTFIEKKQQ
jgi:predicted solute-binding protein